MSEARVGIGSAGIISAGVVVYGIGYGYPGGYGLHGETRETLVALAGFYPPPVSVMVPCPPGCLDDHGSMGDGC